MNGAEGAEPGARGREVEVTTDGLDGSSTVAPGCSRQEAGSPICAAPTGTAATPAIQHHHPARPWATAAAMACSVPRWPRRSRVSR